MNEDAEITLECLSCKDVGIRRIFRGRPEVARAKLAEHIGINGQHGKIQAPKR